MRMSKFYNLFTSLTLIVLIMSANSRKLFMVSNGLLTLGTLNYALTFFTWASLLHSLILLFFERLDFILTSWFMLMTLFLEGVILTELIS